VSPTVVALHGFLGDPRVWDAVASRVEGATWVCPWLPGHGPHATVHEGDFESVLDAWLDPWVPAGAVLVGYSMGARLALSYALRHPGRVRRAVLVSATPGLADAAARAVRQAEDETRAERLLRDGVEPFVAAWETMPMWATQARLGPAVQAAHRARRRAHTPEGLASALRTLGTGAMPSYATTLDAVPTHWLAGGLDTKFVALAEALRGRVEAVTVVPDAGHDLVLEAPDVVAKAVARALAAHKGTTS